MTGNPRGVLVKSTTDSVTEARDRKSDQGLNLEVGLEIFSLRLAFMD